jgi:predicted RNA binding protein YcfA (HicA-like mRNA interferase family)
MAATTPGFNAHIDRFRELLPGVFAAKAEDWQGEGWFDVGSDEIVGPLDWMDESFPRDGMPVAPSAHAERIDFDISGYLAERFGSWRVSGALVRPPRKLRGGHPGSPIAIDGPWNEDRPPPPDAIAFYLPAHHYPRTAGIYFIFENWVQFCVALHAAASKIGPAPTVQQVIDASTACLYAHEHFHHKVEMFGFRWESFSRSRFYTTAVSRLYRKAPDDPAHLEESLATAFGVMAVRERVRNGSLPEHVALAVEDYCRKLPAHYARGLDIVIREAFDAAENGFLERCGIESNPKKFALPLSGLWQSAPYRLAGSIRPGSPFQFLIDRRNSVLARLRLGLRSMRVRELRKELEAHGYRYERQGGNHEIWASSDRRKLIPVPRHPGDLHPGLVRKMLREMRE